MKRILYLTLLAHTKHVVCAVKSFAKYVGLDDRVATNGAILHDLGKAHNYFQKRLRGMGNRGRIFRHEISSIFFLSVFPKEQWDVLIEMVIGHHKSIKKDVANLGLLDLEDTEDYIDYHLGEWEEWSVLVKPILLEFGIDSSMPAREEALDNLYYCIDYCTRVVKERGISKWRGLLMGADHFASAQILDTESRVENLFKVPDLSFYNREHHLYPLSLLDVKSEKRHTIVVAPTGAGKTDYLLRRCEGRVFYTLPFQASINAMYQRIGNDLESTNPNMDVRVLHSSSRIVRRREEDDTSLQGLIGASLTVLTPHQISSIVFGQKGFEALLNDIRGCDIILDEVHTYSGVSQALVVKLIEVLNSIDCRLHIGTATMPSLLYNKVKETLGANLLEVRLPMEDLEKFNRHIVHKIDSFDKIWSKVDESVADEKKILIVVNKVKTAQTIFEQIRERYPEIDSLLLHSRFKRSDRNKKEKELLGTDSYGASLNKYNTSAEACIVVSTQVVEVSLDISFDVMFTETAPLDSLIQRFGRINRKRTDNTIGIYKDVYVVAPPDNETDAKPYDINTLEKSYNAISDGELLRECDMQGKMDEVFTELDLLNIEEYSIFKSDGRVAINKMTHHKESILMQLLEIDSVACITESDVEAYENGSYEDRIMLEIQTRYYVVSKMDQSDKGNKPFIIPDVAYSYDIGLETEKVKLENINVLNQFI